MSSSRRAIFALTIALAFLSLAGGFLFNVPEFLNRLFPPFEEAHNELLVGISVAAAFNLDRSRRKQSASVHLS